jgi:hypothetical protein
MDPIDLMNMSRQTDVAVLPWTSLRAFESASRLGSFKAAARELAVTPGANVRMRASNPGPRRDARCDWILTLKYAHESSHAERGRHRQRKAPPVEGGARCVRMN